MLSFARGNLGRTEPEANDGHAGWVGRVGRRLTTLTLCGMTIG